jgi:hypothetical protein
MGGSVGAYTGIPTFQIVSNGFDVMIDVFGITQAW